MAHDLPGVMLRAAYASLAKEPIPDGLADLIRRLGDKAPEPGSPDTMTFHEDVLAALPDLRRFANGLAPVYADDLVQETLLKAWTNCHRFRRGTNLRARLFTILRNQFYTQIRKRRREIEDADGAAAAQLVALPSQDHEAELREVWSIVATLPEPERAALLLVAAQGMTYEAAAPVLACQVGTVKSRVSRARATVVAMTQTSPRRTFA